MGGRSGNGQKNWSTLPRRDGLCSEKSSELKEGNPRRDFKGGDVLRGDAMRDEDHHAAVFQDLGSSPASMSAAKMTDFLVCFLLAGCAMLVDAICAYCQDLLVVVPIWVRISHD